MRTVLFYLKKYKKETILAPLFKLLEAALELFVPLVIASMIDIGIYEKDVTYIVRMCAVLVLLGAVGLAFSVTAQYFAAKAAVSFATNVRRALFAHIEELSYTEIDTLGTSTLITRMTSDVNQVQSGVNMTLRLLLRSPFIVFGAMIMAFTIDVKAALVFVVTIPALSVVVFAVMLSCIPLYRKVQERLDAVMLSTRENLAGVRVIRAFCREKEETERFRNKNEALTEEQKLVGRILAIMNPATYIVLNIGIVVLIYTGAVRVEMGLLSQGAVVALYNYMAQILEELIKLANLIINITKSVACANRIQDVLSVQSSMPKDISEGRADGKSDAAGESGADGESDADGEGRAENGSRAGAIGRAENGNRAGAKGERSANSRSDAQPERRREEVRPHKAGTIVEFQDVCLRYHGSQEDALSNLNIKVKRNQIIGVIGGTGSGKSSFVNLIPRFYDVTGGHLLIDGKEISAYDVTELRRRIGVVPQKAVLFKGSIRDNMKWGNEAATDEEIWEALRIAQAKDVVEGKDGGLDYMLTAGGRNLSGGQRQRLTIARALVKKPDILILDDSASALDFATDKALRTALRELKDVTVFIVSQRTSSIQQADQIVVLEDGRMEGLGTHEELLKSCQVYQEIYESQFRKEGDAS
ncbi:MAG: ABC transporter ATP-binding protein [Lachnospiraceae bacterium]|nr:ABC transporter ATP-binding protein [Lachnospiraceae bacterium]